MAIYETAGELKTCVNKRVKKINDLIQELPGISGFEDVIDDISDVSEYLDGLSARTDGNVSDDLKNSAKYLSDSLSNIKNYVKDLKGMEFKANYINYTEYSSYHPLTENLNSQNEFLVRKFPKISD